MRQRNFLDPGSSAARAAPWADDAPAPGAVPGWNDVALRAIRAERPDPAPAARSLAILHTCMYNAWAAYDDDARQTPHGFAVRLPRAERGAASKACAMGHAAWLALSACFPRQRAAFDAHAARLGLDPGPAGVLSPAGIGRTQAAAMLDDCRRDGEAAHAPSFAHHETRAAAGGAPAAGPSPADWCLLARAHHAGDDDHDVLLYFVLANALADAAVAAGVGRAGAAAGEALHRFTGDARWADAAAADDWGREVGGLVFDRARRYWQGKAWR